jgi:hypothetical protein
MSTDQIRAEIREPTGWRRGLPKSLRIATRRTLVFDGRRRRDARNYPAEDA